MTTARPSLSDVFAFLAFFSLAVALLGALLLGLGSTPADDATKEALLRFTGPVAALLAFGALYLLGLRWNDVTSPHRATTRELLTCGVACAGSATAFILAASLAQNPPVVTNPEPGIPDLGWYLAFRWLGSGLADPVTEEIAFRGILLTAVGRRFGTIAGIAASTIAFAVTHFAPPSKMLPAALLGLILSMLYVWSRSIWMPIVGHSSWNLTSLLAPAIRKELSPVSDLRLSLLMLFFAGLVALFALRALRRRYAPPLP